MKIFKVLALATIVLGQYVADTDNTCRLLEATCDHEGKSKCLKMQWYKTI